MGLRSRQTFSVSALATPSRVSLTSAPQWAGASQRQLRRPASRAKPGGSGVFDASNCFASGSMLLARGAGDPITRFQRAIFAYFWALRSKSKSARRDEIILYQSRRRRLPLLPFSSSSSSSSFPNSFMCPSWFPPENNEAAPCSGCGLRCVYAIARPA